MPAYSFQRQFAEPILDGTKGGTIRAPRKIPVRQLVSRRIPLPPRPGGHALAGEPLMLYTGMRTRQCRLIAEKRCLAVEPITLDLVHHQVTLHGSAVVFASTDNLDQFARFDGFEDWPALAAFWRATHSAEFFEGWHIRWLALPADIEELARNMAPFAKAAP